ncbi:MULTISPECIES: tyrosine-protein phosphatase [Streptomyces]|uniref:tyrosine-protein phosphatase n=1 Tax=Streptomyces TaxID=1883 RepID=UPI00196373B8|nr:MULTISPECIES: tyrosine-protein phosphatase [Streptomyces]QRX89542.1 tyrosine-protein phosphatase [Streptomyces noursei]UJB39564.1 tyrosine-protein phosphatase [Streptomyces sp. A1-5]
MDSNSSAAVQAARHIAISFVAAVSAVGLTAPLASAQPRTAPAEAPARHAPQASLAAHGIPFTDAKVTQQTDGSFTVTWKAPAVGSVTVYVGDRVVAHGGPEANVTVRGLPAADRQWFRLVPDQGDPLTLADRSLHLPSAPNFRDAGGYRTTDGRWVKMGVLYRSNGLHTLSDADLAKLQRLGIRTDVDLRMPGERAEGPDRVPAGARYIAADVLGEDIKGDLPATAAASERMMVDTYRWLVSKPSALDAYRSLFLLAGSSGFSPLVYHCEGGKDRTGWGNAALLTALGVDRDTVTRDYLATNDYLAARNAATLAEQTPEMAARLKPVLDARVTYLNTAFDEVTARFGSFDAYLRDGLGLNKQDLERLRETLLVD